MFVALQGLPGVLIVVGHFLDSFLLEVNLMNLVIGLYGTLFGQAPLEFLLDLSNKGAIASNSHYFKFISC